MTTARIAFFSVAALQLILQVTGQGLAPAIIAAGMAIFNIIPCFMFNPRCTCRNMYAVVDSYNPPKALNGPRMVFLSEQYDWGTRCQLGTNPITPGGSGGVCVGNSEATTGTGVEGNVFYRMWSDDGKYDLGCNLRIYMDNPYAGENTMTANKQGAGCSQAPITGPADFQSGYNLKVEMGPFISQTTNGGAEVYAYYADQKSSGRRSLMEQKPEPENPCEDEDFVEIGIPVYQHVPIRSHSILHAHDLGKETIKDYVANNCRPIYYPEFGKVCQRQANDEWFEYQYSAKARFVCANGTIDDVIEFATYAFGRQ
ncbi:hypothetical protein PSENEW3_00003520 [Picochlorum sp. SENEW3]|nr:hypothetical protein PSENEW3_00003520 [Picochlorum sp. SENEW3]